MLCTMCFMPIKCLCVIKYFSTLTSIFSSMLKCWFLSHNFLLLYLIINVHKWWTRPDSNWQKPTRYERAALPLSYLSWCPLMVLPHLPPACKTGALLIELNERRGNRSRTDTILAYEASELPLLYPAVEMLRVSITLPLKFWHIFDLFNCRVTIFRQLF